MEKALKVFNWIEDCIKSYRQITLDDSDRQIIKEAKAELEEAMKPKTCATCINRYFERDGLLLIDHYCHLNEFPISEFFGCIRYEPKDNA